MAVLRRRGVIVAVALAAVAAVIVLRSRDGAPDYAVAPVDRGEIEDVVGATGVLQAVTTVQVGSQVSGTIQSLGADFNSVVREGQVVARLDPSLFEARVAQMRANLVAAEANAQRAQAALDDAEQKYRRAQELASQRLLPGSDLETAKATYDGALAQLKANAAAVEQARANLNQAQVDLAHTIIRAPISGVVIARNVDVGQTVAASFQAPVLFVIANDLSRMQVNASIDEADVGRVHQGQPVRFRVDSFPDQSFAGTVEQIRLQPITNQNVVTYNTIIAVDNRGLRLLPGMTATVSVVIDSRRDALRLPAAALRFRPEGVAAPRPSPAGEPGTVAANGGERRSRQPDAPGSAGAARPADGGADRRGQRRALVFVLAPDNRPEPREVRLGLSDGRHVEVLGGLQEGDPVITGVEEPARRGAPRASGAPSSNPFAPGRPQPRSR